MKFLKDTTWDEIYNAWRQRETKHDLWKEYYERKGFKSWEEFRAKHIEQEQLPNLKWKLYEITPEEIPSFHCGNYTNWQKLAKEIGDDTFEKLSCVPFFQNHQKIKNLLADFPTETELIALKKGNDIYLFEGHHRAVALCRLPQKTNITLALADTKQDISAMNALASQKDKSKQA